MTFLEIQDAVLSNAFGEPNRANAKNWINNRYQEMWDAADWIFKRATQAVTVTAGSLTVTNLPADLLAVVGLQDDYGTPLKAILAYQDFADRFVGSLNTAAGAPWAFTVQDGVISVGPTPVTTSAAYVLTYRRALTLLSADSDVPAIPAGYHLALVDGAKSKGFSLSNSPLGAGFEADFQGQIAAMARDYVQEERATIRQLPAYRPGTTPWPR